MVQAKILRRTRAQWPGRNQHLEPYFCAPELLRKGIGDNPPVNGGGGATMGGDAHRSPPPPAAFASFAAAGKGGQLGRAKPCEAARPAGVTAHGGAGGHMGPPLQRLRRITAGRENGEGKPLPKCRGNIPRQRTGRRVWDPPLLLWDGNRPPGGTSPYTEGRF